jgi:hypothetical protein
LEERTGPIGVALSISIVRRGRENLHAPGNGLNNKVVRPSVELAARVDLDALARSAIDSGEPVFIFGREAGQPTETKEPPPHAAENTRIVPRRNNRVDLGED